MCCRRVLSSAAPKSEKSELMDEAREEVMEWDDKTDREACDSDTDCDSGDADDELRERDDIDLARLRTLFLSIEGEAENLSLGTGIWK